MQRTCVTEVLVTSIILAAFANANAEEPTNLHLIAAMPSGTESVMVQRVSMLGSEGSVFREDVEYKMPPHTYSGSKITKVVTYAVWRAEILVYAWGGSDFQSPPRHGHDRQLQLACYLDG